jgi:hypothetical protein
VGISRRGGIWGGGGEGEGESRPSWRGSCGCTLGIRTKQETRYLEVDQWDVNASIVDVSRLKGRECYGGLDLGSTSDLTALAWVFPASMAGSTCCCGMLGA